MMNWVATYRTIRIFGVIAVLATGAAAPAWDSRARDSFEKPTGRVILTVSGNIEHTNDGGVAHFDLEMLHALGVQTVRTSTPWTDGTLEFSGILMSDLLAAVGARGDRVEAIALNDYSYGISREDFERYPVLLATTLNGKELRIRDKGPLWIVYPRDEYSELRTEATDRKMVWQLRRLVVQ